MPQISDEAVQRARKAWLQVFATGSVDDPLAPMRAALTAALPLMARPEDLVKAEALEEAANKLRFVGFAHVQAAERWLRQRAAALRGER